MLDVDVVRKKLSFLIFAGYRNAFCGKIDQEDWLFGVDQEPIDSHQFPPSVCSHSKISQDVSLAKNVPLLNKSLRVLVFRVKVMLATNDCLVPSCWVT